MIAARLALSAWLVYLAVMDLRKGEVTNWATVLPLLVLTLWRTLIGDWPLGLALALVLTGAQWPAFAVPAVPLLVVCSWLDAELAVAITVWSFMYTLWQAGILGGADAKAVMALMALFPDGRLAWLLLLCWAGVSVVYLLRRHGPRALSALPGAAKGLAGRRMPQGDRCPALPAVALAGLLYVWFYPGGF